MLNATPFRSRPSLATSIGSAAQAPCVGRSDAGDVPVALAELVSHRPYLVRFAMRKLRDPALAEDAVHDVMEAVLSGRARFAGRAALRSWLTAVLKNKIVDVLRKSSPYESLDDGLDEAEHPGHAVACGRPGPDEIAEQRQELARALDGIDRLPPTLRDAMRLRIVEDLPTASVCARLGISEENLFVRVHRARKHLVS
ncbi:MAG TPA: sigma-70 family RNA polymerase sigma factor [Caldimonas sp.]|jgi:RNA polymerase sigma-70 factor (ECF subfamily)|nr:sigma-70 family RNA polymerase sigma factor [Caldimonas sp.]HEX4232692.1 sigma-70 family RNA polymerase sigma factor [Caldimonas sp.]